jgi:hypothetical protein
MLLRSAAAPPLSRLGRKFTVAIPRRQSAQRIAALPPICLRSSVRSFYSGRSAFADCKDAAAAVRSKQRFRFYSNTHQSRVFQSPSATCVMLLEIVGARELMSTCVCTRCPHTTSSDIVPPASQWELQTRTSLAPLAARRCFAPVSSQTGVPVCLLAILTAFFNCLTSASQPEPPIR